MPIHNIDPHSNPAITAAMASVAAAKEKAASDVHFDPQGRSILLGWVRGFAPKRG